MQLRKLVITNILIIVSALLVIGVLVFSTINTTIKDQFIHSNEIVLENGSDLVEDFVKQNKNTVLDIAINPTVQSKLDDFHQGDRQVGNIIDYIDSHWSYNHSIKSVGGFMEVYPYKDETLYAFNNTLNNYTEIRTTEWMTDVIKHDGAFTVNTCDIDGMSYIRIAMLTSSIENWPDKFGVLALYVKTEVMFSIFYSIRLENSTSPYLVNEFGEIIIPYENTHNFSKDELLNKENGWWKRGEYIIINVPMTKLEWKLMGILPENKLMENSRHIKNTFIFVGGIMVFFMVLVSVLFSIWISRPIINLSKEMERVEKNDFREVEIGASFGQETKHLYSQFNYMVRRINSLIDEVYLAQIKEKEAELLALQQQINPHFLYNTLDSIAWMSMAYKAEDIRYMVMSLASMMRYSLNEGNNYISVRDELEQVRNYVGIQEIRYDNKFKTSIKADSEVLDHKIIKLIIQPLVENAIVHGFKETNNFGNIMITVNKEEEHLVIKVVNDGIEIDLEKVSKLLNPDTREKPKHYGLHNVNDRLVKSFGKNSGIRFSVNDGKTIAKIRINIALLHKGDNHGDD